MCKAQKFNIFVLLCLLAASLILGAENPDQCSFCNRNLFNIVSGTGLLNIVSQHNVGQLNKENHAQSSYWMTKLESKIVFSPTLDIDKDDIEVFTSGTKYYISVRDGEAKEDVAKKQLLSSYTQQKCRTKSGKVVLMCDSYLEGDTFAMAGVSGKGKLRVIAKKYRHSSWDDTYDLDLSAAVTDEKENSIEEVRLVGHKAQFVALKLSSGQLGSSWRIAHIVRPPLIALFKKNHLEFSKSRYAAVGYYNYKMIYMDFEGHIYKFKDDIIPSSSHRGKKVLPELTELVLGFLQEAPKKSEDKALTLEDAQSTFITAQDNSICLAIQLKGIDNNSKQYKYTHTRFFCQFKNGGVVKVTTPAIREELRSVQLFSSKAYNAYYIMALNPQNQLNVATVRVVGGTVQKEFGVVPLSASSSNNWHENFSYKSLAKCDVDFDGEYNKRQAVEDKQTALSVGFLIFYGSCLAGIFTAMV